MYHHVGVSPWPLRGGSHEVRRHPGVAPSVCPVFGEAREE